MSEGFEQNSCELIFRQHQIEGCFLAWEREEPSPIVYERERANTRFSPASTFKIFHSLVGLELNVITPDEVIPYDGTATDNPLWKRSHTLETAFVGSVVWYYRQLAPRIGRENFLRYLADVSYGNALCVGTETAFWLDGSLTISPVEQIHFLRRFSSRKLPFSDEVCLRVKSFMRTSSTLPGEFYSKTGWSNETEGNPGWFVGFWEFMGRAVQFVCLIEMEREELAPLRKKITEQCLTEIFLKRSGCR